MPGCWHHTTCGLALTLDWLTQRNVLFLVYTSSPWDQTPASSFNITNFHYASYSHLPRCSLLSHLSLNTACHVNNPLQYSLPRQQPVRAFRLSPASKLHTRRAAFPKKAEITSCGKHSLPVCTLLGVQHQRWWHQQTENTDRQGRLCDCLLKFEAVVQRRWLNKLLSNTDHPEHPLHHFLDGQLSTFSNRQMQDTGNLSDLMQ